MTTELTTLDQVEAAAAAQGIILTPADRAKIAAVQAAERTRLEQLSPAARRGFADRWNAFYPRLLAMIVSVGETVLTFAQTIITALGVPVVLALLLVVEHHRVVEGILLFDQNTTFAGFAAAALVLLNLVLEFQVHYVEHRAGYSEHRATRWSLRLWAANMAYRLGLGDRWQAQQLSPAARYKQLLSLVTFTILALALVGSMKAVISQTSGTWYEAIAAIVSDSSLLLMMTWAGGLLFAVAAVLSAQGLSRYVAIRCVEIVAAMEFQQLRQEDPHAADVERAGARAAQALIAEKLNKRTNRTPSAPAIAAPPVTEEDTEPVPVNPTQPPSVSSETAA